MTTNFEARLSRAIDAADRLAEQLEYQADSHARIYGRRCPAADARASGARQVARIVRQTT